MMKAHRSSFAVLVVCAAALLAVEAAAQDHKPLSDTQIQEQIQHRLSDQRISGVKVAVKNGDVTLTGTVRSAWAKDKAAEIARKADDVQSVTSELTVSRGESDRSIAEKIGDQIQRYVFYSIFDDVNGSVNNGIVTLTGRVTTPLKVQQIGDLVSRVPGVQQVNNQLRTLPTSMYDDQLRVAIATAIYNDPVFTQYAIGSDHPIHIIVENSQVTLTGIVASPLERQKAEVLARGIFGALGVENKLQVQK